MILFSSFLFLALGILSTEFSPSLGKKACEKIVCPLLYNPVCGSDGNSYDNKCELERANCMLETGSSVTVAHEGRCVPDPCKEVNQNCPRNYRPLIASNGKVYSNECVFNAAACSMSPVPVVLHKFFEVKDCQVSCPRILGKRVCGNNGITYPNMCALSEASCKSVVYNEETVIEKDYDGDCEKKE